MLAIDRYNGAPSIERLGRLLAEQTIKALESRNINGCYFGTKEEAAQAVMGMIPEGSSVGFGGSVTLHELGLYERILKGPYQSFNRFDATLSGSQILEVQRNALLADVFLSGTNAVTSDGRLVNIDGTGNRVAALLFGPRKVIVVSGVNKIVHGLENAIGRVKERACPLNADRLGLKTPCSLTGACHECSSGQRMCNLLTVIEGQKDPGRFTVVLVGENLGF